MASACTAKRTSSRSASKRCRGRNTASGARKRRTATNSKPKPATWTSCCSTRPKISAKIRGRGQNPAPFVYLYRDAISASRTGTALAHRHSAGRVQSALSHVEETLFVLPKAFPHKLYEGASFEARVEMLRAATADSPNLSIAV